MSHPSGIGYRRNSPGITTVTGSGSGQTTTTGPPIPGNLPTMDSGTSDGSTDQELARLANFMTGGNENPTSTQPAATPRSVQAAVPLMPTGSPAAHGDQQFHPTTAMPTSTTHSRSSSRIIRSMIQFSAFSIGQMGRAGADPKAMQPSKPQAQGVGSARIASEHGYRIVQEWDESADGLRTVGQPSGRAAAGVRGATDNLTDQALNVIGILDKLDRAVGGPVEMLTNAIDAFAAGMANQVSNGATDRARGNVR